VSDGEIIERLCNDWLYALDVDEKSRFKDEFDELYEKHLRENRNTVNSKQQETHVTEEV
jgi:hypothetical protein